MLMDATLACNQHQLHLAWAGRLSTGGVLSAMTTVSFMLAQIDEYLTTGAVQALSPEEDAKKAADKQKAAAEVEKSAAYAFL